MRYQSNYLLLCLILLSMLPGCKSGNGPLAPGEFKITACFKIDAWFGLNLGTDIRFDASCSTDNYFDIVEFTWDWGDGSDPESVDSPEIYHVFEINDVYEITLTIVDKAGNEASTSRELEIREDVPGANFTFTAPDDFYPGKEILFDASHSVDAHFEIVEYRWDWDDGSDVLSTVNPEISHIFESIGIYEVELTVRNSFDKEGSRSQEVEIVEIPDSLPSACFTYDSQNGWEPGTEIYFDASCSRDVDVDDITWIWDWDDGNPAEEFNSPHTSHVFDTPDATVVLTVRDEDGNEDSSEPLELTFGIPVGSISPAKVYTESTFLDTPTWSFAFNENYMFIAKPGTVSTYPQNEHSHGTSDEYADPLQVACADDLLLVNRIIEDSGIRFVELWDVTDGQPLQAYTWHLNADYIGVSENLAFIHAGTNLQIWDVTDPFSPVFLSSVPQAEFEFFIEGSRLFSNAYGNVVKVYNISNPGEPVLEGTLPFVPAAVDGYTAYWVSNSNLYTVDITNPDSYQVLGSCELWDNMSNSKIELCGTRLLVRSNSDLETGIVDVSNPMLPEIEGSVNMDFRPTQVICVQPPYINMVWKNSIPMQDYPVYYTIHYYNVSVLDISEPDGPQFASSGSIDTGLGQVGDIDAEMSWKHAYIVSNPGGLNIVELDDPLNPILIGQSDAITGARKLVVNYDRVYVGCDDPGLVVIDTSDRSNPVITGSAICPNTRDLTINGNLVYVVGEHGSTVKIFDLTDRDNPELIADYGAPVHGSTVEYHNGWLSIGTDDAELIYVDVNDPESLYLTYTMLNIDRSGGYEDTDLSNGALCIYDDYLWYEGLIFCCGPRLTICDISSPPAIFKIRSQKIGYSNPSSGLDFHVTGNYVYLPASSTLRIAKINSLQSISQIGMAPVSPNSAKTVGVECDFALTAGYSSGLDGISYSVVRLW